MAGEGIAVVYYGAVTVFQLAVAIALLFGRKTAVKMWLALLLSLSALETLHFMAASRGSPIFHPVKELEAVDAFIVITIPFILLKLVNPRQKWPIYAWVGVAGLWAILVPFFLAVPYGEEPILNYTHVLQLLFHQWPPVVSALLIAVLVIPAWAKLGRGPTRARLSLLLIGLGTGVMMWAGEPIQRMIIGPLFFDAPYRAFAREFGLGYWLSLVLRDVVFLGAYIASIVLAINAARARKPGSWLVLGAFVAAFVIGARATFWGQYGWAEFPSQALRPAMVALAFFALERYDYPAAMQRIIPRVIAVIGLPVLFIVSALVVMPNGPKAPSLTWQAMVFGFLVTGAVFVFLWRALVKLDGAESVDVGSLERYRLALEEGASETQLHWLRQELRIDTHDARALQDIVWRGLEVDTRAVMGPTTGTLVGRYAVERRVAGAAQRTWLAIGPEGEQVIVKEITVPWRVDETPDAKPLAGVGTISGVATPLGIYTWNGVTFAVREYVIGDDLADSVLVEGSFSRAKARKVTLGLLRTLGELHSQNVFGIDLRPDNIVITKTGIPTILDLRKVPTRGSKHAGPVEARRALMWMSPEQVTLGTIDHRTDIWSIGCLIHFMITGRRHTDGHGPNDVPEFIVEGRPPRNKSGEPADLARLRSWCLQRRKDQRPQNVQEALALMKT